MYKSATQTVNVLAPLAGEELCKSRMKLVLYQCCKKPCKESQLILVRLDLFHPINEIRVEHLEIHSIEG